MGVPYEDVVFAIDAVQEPVSLFEPIYNEGGDPILMMDQISDDKINDEEWDDHLSIKEGMHRLTDREKMIIEERFSAEKHKLKWRKRSEFPKHKYHDLKKQQLSKFEVICFNIVH